MARSINSFEEIESSVSDFSELISFVAKLIGEASSLKLGERQLSMMHARLSKRMLSLGLDNPLQYIQYIATNRVIETEALISLLTTHHTYFFREFDQFTFLLQRGLQDIVRGLRAAGREEIRILSVGCSRGHEVYSLAMFLDYHLPEIAPGVNYSIVGIDIDRQSIAIAKNGVYRWDEVKEIPRHYLGAHWVRGTEEISNFVKVKTSLKRNCQFEYANILHLDETFRADEPFDLVFCRNVFIYFTELQIESSCRAIVRHLHPWSYLFVGLSETLNGRGLPLKFLGDASYKLISAENVIKPVPKIQTIMIEDLPSPVPVFTKPIVAPVRVLCVDDSSTILALLKEILTPDDGFEVVGTARNGKEAAERFDHSQFDVMTLDTHLPLMNGVDYLATHYSPDHPPVVIVSSVLREDSKLGFRALELGATDYLEKPAAINLNERGEELRAKLRSAHASRKRKLAPQDDSLGLDRSFIKSCAIESPETKLRVFVATLGDRQKLSELLSHLEKPQPQTVLLIECSDGLLPELLAALVQQSGQDCKLLGEADQILHSDTVYLASAYSHWEAIYKFAEGRHVVALLFDSIAERSIRAAAGLKGAKLIMEEAGEGEAKRAPEYQALIAFWVPYTSFLNDSDKYLNGFAGT